MPLIDEREMDELRNLNEAKVWEALELFLAANPAVCQCRDCVLDTAAIALNRLPARYRVSPLHGSDPAADAAHEKLVAETVKAAAALVSQRPHHL